MKSPITLIAVVMMLALTASAQKELKLDRVTKLGPSSVDAVYAAGVFTGTGYENSALGFSMTAPGGFKKVSDAENSAALEAGKAIIKEGRSARSSRDLDNSVAKTRVLFQYHGGGASLAAGVERVPVGTTGKAYADANVNILRGVSRTKLSKPVVERSLGGRNWHLFEVQTTNDDGGVISQVYLTRVDGAFALFFVASIGDPFLEDAIIQSLNSLKFK